MWSFGKTQYAVANVPDQTIYRFMDLARFNSLLVRGALYFSRADKIGDPWEATLSQEDWSALQQSQPRWREVSRSVFSGIWHKFRQIGFLNCWYAAAYESTALWGVYAHKNAGVAIRSTTLKLMQSLVDDHLYIGAVRYIDFDSEQTQFH
jgi:hypothetical protein